jgi:predicted transglutaminase-like protease
VSESSLRHVILVAFLVENLTRVKVANAMVPVDPVVYIIHRRLPIRHRLAVTRANADLLCTGKIWRRGLSL